jgi:hypothetical protein
MTPTGFEPDSAQLADASLMAELDAARYYTSEPEQDPNILDIPEAEEPFELFEELHQKERERIGTQVKMDFEAALMGHRARMERFQRYWRLWKNVADTPVENDDEATYRVPMVQATVFAKWAQNLDSLFGDDAEITAQPIGPSDTGTAAKVGCFMDWRVFSDMKLVNPFAVFEFRKLLYGRSFAYAPWVRKHYWVNAIDPKTGKRAKRQELAYEGPGFEPLHPDDLLVPAERVDSIQDFSFVIRKIPRMTPQQLLDGETEGRFFGISDNWEKIVNAAAIAPELEVRGDEGKLEEQYLEGVNTGVKAADQNTGKLTVYEWYGHWRLPAKLGADVELSDAKKRDRIQTEMRVYFVPDLDLVIGVDDLADLYPQTPKRRPIVEASMVKDGEYWGMGLGEMLEQIEDESTHVHRTFMSSGEMAAGPVIIARPGSGLKRGETQYKPWTVVWSDDPAGVKTLDARVDHNWAIAMGQSLQGFKEQTTGVSDANVGRSTDRPNAPRTASGQLALIEQGNIRASIDTRSLKEDFSEIAAWFWLLETMFGSSDTFFRVTEEDAGGLFDVKQGGSHLTEAERGGRFDFRVKFASSYWSREAKKERFLQLYQMLSLNPLVASNPAILGQVTRELCKQLGHPDIAALIPMPAQIDAPRTPAQEWTLMLEGRDAPPHPQDNDAMHLVDHERQLQLAMQSADPDPDAIMRLQDHIAKQQIQQTQKMQMQAMASAVVQQAQTVGQMATPEHGGNVGTGSNFGGGNEAPQQ